MFDITRTYSYSGNTAATLNSLTNATNVTNLTIADLSVNNYPTGDANNSMPNEANQLIFMNQTMSWWLDALQNKKVIYTPVSNYVNWSYKNDNVEYHISITISDLLIPNSSKSTEFNNDTQLVTIVYNEKLGMGCTETQGML